MVFVVRVVRTLRRCGTVFAFTHGYLVSAFATYRGLGTVSGRGFSGYARDWAGATSLASTTVTFPITMSMIDSWL